MHLNRTPPERVGLRTYIVLRSDYTNRSNPKAEQKPKRSSSDNSVRVECLVIMAQHESFVLLSIVFPSPSRCLGNVAHNFAR